MSSMDDQLSQLQRFLDIMHNELPQAAQSVSDPEIRGHIEDLASRVSDAKSSLVSQYKQTMSDLDSTLNQTKQSAEETIKRAQAARKKAAEESKKASKEEAAASKKVASVKGTPEKDAKLGSRLRKDVLHRYALQPAAEGTLKPHVPVATTSDWEDWFQSSWDG
ncbi:hypothetical protein Pan216_32780 [Planctomycetes bacterium Pan216]|uniref:Uncharacterized protein n=1 Tax=Kolteria novifilia TaxID=2527975 RepID=A0A518B609_9BACT|nr:hypothetical protein Pan216_32780 [Planctomycetes bacterium Pan216]